MKSTQSRPSLKLLLSLVYCAWVAPAAAVNWPLLQGTEPLGTTHRPVVIFQPNLTVDESSRISAGPNNGRLLAPATIAPWFNNQDRLRFTRLRLGLRGHLRGAGQDQSLLGKTNYFLMAELAPNLFTYEAFGERERLIGLDHVSLTFNHMPSARLRVGLFKMPGPEESYQGVINIDYNEFTAFTAGQVLEIFTTGNRRASPSGGTNFSLGTPVDRAYGFSAVRDWGVQLFDNTFIGPWELSYAVTLGRGEDIHTLNPGYTQLERYLYLSAEHDLPGGKGPFKHGIKLYGWHQQGERRFESDPLHQTFDRVRYGLGVRALGRLLNGTHKHRIAGEWMTAEGMLFVGPVGGVEGGDLQFAAERGNEAQGLSLDYGFFVDEHWELDFRWARNDLLRRADRQVWTTGDRRVLTEQTLGIAYHFKPTNRITFNYTFRDLDAPNETNPIVQNAINSLGNRWSLQWNLFY